MRTQLRHWSWAILAIAIAEAAMVIAQPGETRSARVALTFDDLPVHAALPTGVTRTDIATRIVTTLRARRTPAVYGFINAQPLADESALSSVLTTWREAGHLLGNHGFAHQNLHKTTAVEFEHDITSNEPTLQSLMPDGRWRWFRFPFLNEGNTPEQHQRIADFLKGRGYRTAQVTLSFDDWAYSDPYARCASKGDQAAIEQLKTSYLKRAAESLPRGQRVARDLFGRDIEHIMLLHIGAVTALLLPDVLDLLDAQGFTLTTLEEAASDAAYTTPLPFPSSRSGTFFDQLMSARKTPMPKWQEDPFDMLSRLCF